MDLDDPILTCPYNKSHSIIQSRMQFHLTKCRHQHPTSEKAICPFNSTHVIPQVEYDYHQHFCEDRIILDTFTCKVGSSSAPKSQISNVEPFVIKSDENWEICLHIKVCDDRKVLDAFTCKVGSSEVPKVNFSTEPIEIAGVESWDASDDAPVSVLEKVHEVSKTKPTLQALVGAPKSERKAFRHQERLRIQHVLDSKEKEERDRYGRKVEVQEGSGQKGQESEGSHGTLKERVAAEMITFNQAQAQNRAAMNATSGGPKAKSVKPRIIQSFARPIAQRDPKNAWGTVKRNEQLDSIGGGDAPCKGARDEGVPTATISASEVKFKPSSQARERDPSNPWRARKPPSSSPTTNINTSKPEDFPSLPPSGRGRGKYKYRQK